jgi:hypothetical protein
MAVESGIQTAERLCSQLHTPDEYPIPIHKTDGSKNLETNVSKCNLLSNQSTMSFNIIVSNQNYLSRLLIDASPYLSLV